MEGKAILRNARIAPRKVEIVLNLIRGKDLETALAIVKHTPKAACEYIEKLLNSAHANVENKAQTEIAAKDLVVSMCNVGPGPIMKRIRPRAQGRAFRVLKRTSHITIVLSEKE